jgi:hypothetical protein
MPLICINPDGLPTPETYNRLVVATGSKWVSVSGQEPETCTASWSAVVSRH